MQQYWLHLNVAAICAKAKLGQHFLAECEETRSITQWAQASRLSWLLFLYHLTVAMSKDCCPTFFPCWTCS